MSRDDDQKLHRVFDGVERGPVDEEKLAALGELRALLRNTAEGASAGIDVWAGVERGIARGGATVIPFTARLRKYRPVWVSTLAAAAAALALYVSPLRGGVGNGCVIESLETGTAVILAPDDEDDEATVLWLDDEEEES
jgi:hypothetical protein